MARKPAPKYTGMGVFKMPPGRKRINPLVWMLLGAGFLLAVQHQDEPQEVPAPVPTAVQTSR